MSNLFHVIEIIKNLSQSGLLTHSQVFIQSMKTIHVVDLFRQWKYIHMRLEEPLKHQYWQQLISKVIKNRMPYFFYIIQCICEAIRRQSKTKQTEASPQQTAPTSIYPLYYIQERQK